MDDLFNMYAKYSEKLIFLTISYHLSILTFTYAYQEVRNVAFSENFMSVPNE